MIKGTPVIGQTRSTLLPKFSRLFQLEDNGRPLAKKYYEPELQKSEQTMFHIEKILGWKTVNGKRFGRVKWLGYDSSYNSWEPEENIKHLKDL